MARKEEEESIIESSGVYFWSFSIDARVELLIILCKEKFKHSKCSYKYLGRYEYLGCIESPIMKFSFARKSIKKERLGRGAKYAIVP